MKRKTTTIIVLMALVFGQCKGKLEVVNSFSKGPNGQQIPAPTFNKSMADILSELKTKYDASSVTIGRPIKYSNTEGLKYWIKASILNPELENRNVAECEKDIATFVASHLTNARDFEQIEVEVAQKKGFMITYSQTRSSFFLIDSLQTNTHVTTDQ